MPYLGRRLVLRQSVTSCVEPDTGLKQCEVMITLIYICTKHNESVYIRKNIVRSNIHIDSETILLALDRF